MDTIKKVLTIAGSDSSGGAGIQTDLKTFAAHGVYGMSAITAITAQNTMRVKGVETVSPEMVYAQIAAVCEDIGVDAVKIGMLANGDIIQAVYEAILDFRLHNIVLDPVMVSTSGHILLQEDGIHKMQSLLFPLADILTPNLKEAELIYNKSLQHENGVAIDSQEKMKEVLQSLKSITKGAILLKGGHLSGVAEDMLLFQEKIISLKSERIDTPNTHGTGCTLSASLAANLALGYDLVTATQRSKKFITAAIKNGLSIGKGHGPTNPMKGFEV